MYMYMNTYPGKQLVEFCSLGRLQPLSDLGVLQGQALLDLGIYHHPRSFLDRSRKKLKASECWTPSRYSSTLGLSAPQDDSNMFPNSCSNQFPNGKARISARAAWTPHRGLQASRARRLGTKIQSATARGSTESKPRVPVSPGNCLLREDRPARNGLSSEN